MRRRLAAVLRAIADRLDPRVIRRLELPVGFPIAREDVEDFYGGIVPPGRRVV